MSISILEGFKRPFIIPGKMGNKKWAKPCVIKKIGKSFAIWFPPSQSFVLLKSPAIEILRGFEQGKSEIKIISELIQKTGSNEIEIQNFLKEVLSGFDALMDSENLPYTSPEIEEEINHFTFSNYAVKFYRINGKSFRIIFGDEILLQHFDQLFSHLQIESCEDTDFNLEIFLHKNVYLFCQFGSVIEAFRPEQIHYLKGAVLKKIAGLIYAINEENWMASFHASAICDGKNAILFSAKPGGGKSTIAALLQARGYFLLSDDFIALDNQLEHVWNMPMALTIKKGSLKILSSYYPKLNYSVSQITATGKNVHYLIPKKQESVTGFSFPLKLIVFIRYSKEIQFLVEKISPEEALIGLLEETWVNPTSKNIKQFLNWFSRQQYVRITYSDSNLVFDELDKILKHD